MPTAYTSTRTFNFNNFRKYFMLMLKEKIKSAIPTGESHFNAKYSPYCKDLLYGV